MGRSGSLPSINYQLLILGPSTLRASNCLRVVGDTAARKVVRTGDHLILLDHCYSAVQALTEDEYVHRWPQ